MQFCRSIYASGGRVWLKDLTLILVTGFTYNVPYDRISTMCCVGGLGGHSSPKHPPRCRHAEFTCLGSPCIRCRYAKHGTSSIPPPAFLCWSPPRLLCHAQNARHSQHPARRAWVAIIQININCVKTACALQLVEFKNYKIEERKINR